MFSWYSFSCEQSFQLSCSACFVNIHMITSLKQCPPEVHANAAETLCAITRNASSALAAKLSRPRLVVFWLSLPYWN